MNKAIKILAALLLIILLLCGCGRQMEQIGDESKAATRFSVVDEYEYFSVIVDMDTGVMYAMQTRKGTYGGSAGSLTLLVNWDGSPRCYPGFDAREDRQP